MATPLTTSISLTWDQPQADDAVDIYEINYSFTVNECSGNEGNFQPVTVMLADRSLRSYTIMNSSTSRVEEDSTYSISLTAVNSVERSTATTIMAVATDTAGVFCHSYMHAYITLSPIQVHLVPLNH